MSLNPLLIATQGLFPLTPIAAAVQGLLAGDAPLPPADERVYRPPVVGRSPGTTINASDYLEALRRRSAIAPGLPVAANSAPTLAPQRRRRRNLHALRAAALVLE
jgi:hypothetical protein